jgi:hypothetical protein
MTALAMTPEIPPRPVAPRVCRWPARLFVLGFLPSTLFGALMELTGHRDFMANPAMLLLVGIVMFPVSLSFVVCFRTWIEAADARNRWRRRMRGLSEDWTMPPWRRALRGICLGVTGVFWLLDSIVLIVVGVVKLV